MATSDNACQGTTKAGKPCRSTALRPNGYCAVHDPTNPLPLAAMGADAGKRSGEVRRENNAVKLLRAAIEADPNLVVDTLLSGLEASRHIVVGNGPTAHSEEVPDQATQLRAAEMILDRIYGRPKQTTELSGPDEGPIEVVTIVPLDAEQRSAKAAELLKRHGHVD